jgi:acyl-CoA synthetase (AMP-forming)/AMP-acid ligase II
VLGEEVASAVVLHEPGGANASALLKHCRDKLAEYKVPKKIFIVPSIPLTATGKVRRKQVAAALLDGQLL